FTRNNGENGQLLPDVLQVGPIVYAFEKGSDEPGYNIAGLFDYIRFDALPEDISPGAAKENQCKN
ncbi:MAG: hypothetical protein MJA83_07330, partial [Gammaproteobacteria bacterium]|nr:hypothetical protein [Gammaproteobacteria bacterium]